MFKSILEDTEQYHPVLKSQEITIEYPLPEYSDGDEDLPLANVSDKWKLKLAKRNKQLAKVQSRIRSCQVRMAKQEEQLRSLQEAITKKRSTQAEQINNYSWDAIKAANVISKIFFNCQPIAETQEEIEDRNRGVASKFKYTADFHKFAIALYFFAPKAYFFVSTIVPVFPQKHYLRQWVHSEHIEKFMPDGISCRNGSGEVD